MCAAVAACGEFAAPSNPNVSFAVVPVFGSNAAFASDANRLRIILLREVAGEFTEVARVVVDIDPVTGTADTTLQVSLTASPTLFRIVLEAVRSADGMVLFTGSSDVLVEAGTSGGATPVEIPVTYAGPTAATVILAPRDTAVDVGGTFRFRATAFDGQGSAVDVPLRFFLVNAADATRLTVDRLSGDAEALSAGGQVSVFVRTADTAAADTTRVFLGVQPGAIQVTPGYANVGVESSVRLDAILLDANGNPAGTATATWTSRDAGVAMVDGSGLVTGVAPGTAVIVAVASGFTDSALVTVPPAGDVVVSTTSNDRAFRVTTVGDTVVVDVIADMTFTPSELLGSYNAVLTWDPSVLSFLDVQPGDFPVPQVNSANAAVGELRFAQAEANGAAGTVVVARVRLVTLAAGSTVPAVAITEMSAAQTFTDLLARVTVTSGTVTVQ
jgi:hypothetical protein